MSSCNTRVVAIKDPKCGKKLFKVRVNSFGEITAILPPCGGFTINEKGLKEDCKTAEIDFEEIKKQLINDGIYVK